MMASPNVAARMLRESGEPLGFVRPGGLCSCACACSRRVLNQGAHGWTGRPGSVREAPPNEGSGFREMRNTQGVPECRMKANDDQGGALMARGCGLIAACCLLAPAFHLDTPSDGS